MLRRSRHSRPYGGPGALGHQQVVPDRHVGEHLHPLIGAADAETGPLVGRQPLANCIPPKTMSPGIGAQLPAHAVEQRRLAGAVGTDQADALPCPTSNVMVCTAWIPPNDLQTPRRLRRGSCSAMDRLLSQASRHHSFVLRAGIGVSPWERTLEQSLESPHRPRFWYSSTPSGCYAYVRAPKAKSTTVRLRECGPGEPRSFWITKNPKAAWMAPSTVVTLVVTTNTTNERRRRSSPGGRDSCCMTSRGPPIAGDGPGEGEDDDALPGRIDAETGRGGLTPPHGRQVGRPSPCGPSGRPTDHDENRESGRNIA